jgi:hypothetical protein
MLWSSGAIMLLRDVGELFAACRPHRALRPRCVKRLQPLGHASLTGRALGVSIAGQHED